MSQVDRAGYLYLGRRLDADEPLFYEASDLTTHVVCLGMTGSGKTGLGIVLLEEAILQGVPVLAIDPKGDIANLLLTFPDLRPEDFRPWVSVDAARRRDLSLDAYAEEVSGAWADGLDRWGIPAERIEEAGQRAARERAVSHCYERPSFPPRWPYNLMTMIHGRSENEVREVVQRLLADLKPDAHAVLFSHREFKKQRVRYFEPDFPAPH